MDKPTTRRRFFGATAVGLGVLPVGAASLDAVSRKDASIRFDGSAGSANQSPQAGLHGEGLSVADFGAVGDNATDNAASLNAAIRAASLAKHGYLDFPAGTFLCSTALALPTGLTLRGSGKHRTFLKFTGATDGIVVSDPYATIGLRDLAIETNNARARKAIRFGNKAFGASNCLIENVDIVIEDGVTGRWDYGVWATNWQNSRVSGVRVAYGCDVGIHLEYGCNATTWNSIEVVGYNGSTRGIELFGHDTSATASFATANASDRNSFDSYWYGVTVQGAFSASCLYVEGCSPKVFGCHPENTEPSPSDGADICLLGGGINNASLSGVTGGSLKTSGVIRNFTVTQSELNTVVIGAGTFGGLYGGRFTSLTDNSGGSWDTITASLGNGNPYPSTINDLVVANREVIVPVSNGTVALPATPAARITLTTASATHVGHITGGRDGQQLVIGFGDTNATLKTTGNLKIGTDFRPSNTNARIVLEKQGGNWFQLSRFAG